MLKVNFLSKTVFEQFIHSVDPVCEILKIAEVQNKDKETQIHAFCSENPYKVASLEVKYLWIFSNDNANKIYSCKITNGKKSRKYSDEFNAFVEKNCAMMSEDVRSKS